MMNTEQPGLAASFMDSMPYIPQYAIDCEMRVSDEAGARFLSMQQNQRHVTTFLDANNRKVKKMVAQMTDADGSVFLRRQLEFISQQVFETLYQNIEYRNVFPILNLENAGITSYTYKVVDHTGKAKYIGSDVNDLPRASVSGKDVNTLIKAAGISYVLSRQELASASFANMSLAELEARSARRAMEELFEETAFLGNSETNLNGLLTDPNIPVGNVPNGAGGNPEWSTKTPDEIVADITDALTEVFESSKKRHRPNTVLLPISQWSRIMSRARSTTSDTSIAQLIVDNSPYLTSRDQFVAIPQLAGAGTGGADVMVVYERNPDNVQFVIGLEQRFLDPQFININMVVPSWATTGGLVVRRPVAFTIKEDI